MAISTTLIGIVVLVIVVWILMETKKFKHKLFEIFLIFFILFLYFSFTFVVGGKADLTSWDGISKGGSLYLSWLGSVFSNLKTITSNAIHMNWGVNGTNSSVGSAVSSAANSIILNLTNAS